MLMVINLIVKIWYYQCDFFCKKNKEVVTGASQIVANV